MKTGIIAQTLGKTPASVGYDLVPKRPGQKTTKGPEDYELLFRGFTSMSPAKVENVLANFDLALDRIYNDEIKTQATVKEELNEDCVLAELNGEIIRSIAMRNSKEVAVLQDGICNEEEQTIVNQLLEGWAQLRLDRIAHERKVAAAMRKGVLDIYVKDGTETLETFDGYDADGNPQWKPAPAMVKPEQIRASLFFLLDLYRTMDRFKAAINIEHQEGNYIFAYEKGELEFYIADGSDPTEFELKVMKDIKKIKM
jgi:hypothetical protein